MNFKIDRVSARSREKDQPCEGAVFVDRNWWIIVESLEDLMQLRRSVNADLIVGVDHIWIYDGYFE